MSILICENPKCTAVGRGESPRTCSLCRHTLIARCRRCKEPIRSSTDLMCRACGAPYKLKAPLPGALLERRSGKP